MAVSTLPITGSWWGTGGNARWTEENFIQSGQSNGANYRSKIALSTVGLTIIKSSRMIVKIPHYSLSSPFGVEGILTENNEIPANDCQNRFAGAASDSLNKAAIARSYAYKDEDGKEPLTTETGVNVAAGNAFYLIFDVADLKQDKTYYLYFIRNLRDGYTGSGWFEAYKADIVATLDYTNYTACTAPTWMTVTPEVFETSVHLEWGGAAGGESNEITGYNIRYNFSADKVNWSGWADINPVKEPVADIPLDVERGTYVAFAVRAIGGAGEEFASGWYIPEGLLAVKNRLPEVPAGLSGNALIASGGTVELSWEEALDPDGQVCGYIVGREMNGQWVEADNGQDTHFSEVRTGKPGQTLNYAVRTYDALGAKSGWQWCKRIVINSPPVAPADGRISAEEYSPGDAVVITWIGATDVDENISGHIIGWRLDEGGEWNRLLKVDTTENFGSVTIAPDQAQYHERIYFAVMTVDNLGAESAWKEIGSVLRNDIPHAHVFSNKLPGNYVPVICEGRYMPYIRVNGQWIRHPGTR